jgi:hypothetical protein
MVMTDKESTQSQELFGKTEELEAKIKRLQELADYRLRLLTKMPSERKGTMPIEAMKQALDALNNTDTHPLSSAEQYFKEMNAMEALEDAIADTEEVAVDWEAVAADQAMTISMLKQREWQGLTYAEISEEADRLNLRDGTLNGAISFANVISTKLKEKNHD